MNGDQLATALNGRAKEFGVSAYTLSKAILRRRGQAGPASKLSSMVTRLLKNPEAVNVRSLQEVIGVLGGRIEIVWDGNAPVTQESDGRTTRWKQPKQE